MASLTPDNHSSTNITIGKLSIASCLHEFIQTQALPGSQVSSHRFWSGFEALLTDLMPQNQALLVKRDQLQQQIDQYCKESDATKMSDYMAFLKEIGYLETTPAVIQIDTNKVDDEIAVLAGPQLVVPVNNARYAVNAANARWGSLYDALYGTDVISEENGMEKGSSYNEQRGAEVVRQAKLWLDIIAPLQQGSHLNATAYQLVEEQLQVTLTDGAICHVNQQTQVRGYQGNLLRPSAILLQHHGLHIELQFDPTHPVGQKDPTGLKDILVEAALTTIMDCEDSVAAVDAEDKTLVYQNWLGLMQGSLSLSMNKSERLCSRKLLLYCIHEQLNRICS
jgi:malate synthase